jgi:tRNA(fMet)-specific endonuclease VapC
MYILDTDHLSLLEHRGSFNRQRLLNRLANVGPQGVAATIVSFEEQMRGRLAFLARSKTIDQQIEAYQRLRNQLDNYCSMAVLDFDIQAASHFRELKGQRLRVGTMDLKIAAIVTV